MNIYNLSLVLLAAFQIELASALTHETKIKRPDTFPPLPGQSRFDISTYEPSLVQIVTPAPLSTMVEVLRVHSDPLMKSFVASHTSALQGTRVMMGASYEKRAQADYNMLIQDYMPMNESDAAAAKYLLSVSSCTIRRTDKMPAGMTACQYNGAKIMADIVKRLSPIHSLMTTGSVQTVSKAVKTVPIVNPPELTTQIAKIVGLLGGDSNAALLQKTDPSLWPIWNDIRSRIGK